jgi:hypothetical protein
MLELAVSLASHHPVILGDAVSGLDDRSTALEYPQAQGGHLDFLAAVGGDLAAAAVFSAPVKCP